MIAAIATPPGRGAIGVVRISGPGSIEIAGRVFSGARNPSDLPGYGAALGWIIKDGARVDEVICLVMRGPKSFTGEDVAEFHCHGGPAVLRLVLEAVISAGARPAEPGEFTRRAFLAGRIDLSQAEGVADIIASETEAAARAAASQLEGALSERIGSVKDDLVRCLALAEAAVDFSDQEDVPEGLEELDRTLESARAKLQKLIEDAGRGKRYREGARVVIAGKPNVGKSTLMNALLGSDRVIVTSSPGATRDVIEDSVEIGGIPIRLFDTAGLREGGEEAEMIGMKKTIKSMSEADLVIIMLDGSRPLEKADLAVMTQAPPSYIVAVNKTDLPSQMSVEEVAKICGPPAALHISALTGEGLDGLEQAIADKLLGGKGAASPPFVTNVRHENAIREALDNLARALAARQDGLSEEFLAADLSRALDSLGLITGETADEDILDIIFERFCIGK